MRSKEAAPKPKALGPDASSPAYPLAGARHLAWKAMGLDIGAVRGCAKAAHRCAVTAQFSVPVKALAGSISRSSQQYAAFDMRHTSCPELSGSGDRSEARCTPAESVPCR